ncbi:unnamed protein product [Closterium sp. Yama58-4]|nr:unnamed protein product [Closterium sp. Yama58-4]
MLLTVFLSTTDGSVSLNHHLPVFRYPHIALPFPPPSPLPTHSDFSETEITGGIPPFFGKEFTSSPPVEADLSETEISGGIPAFFSAFGKLVSLSIGSTSISGNIPRGFSRLVNLQALRLNNNLLSGFLPDLGAAKSLRQVDVSSNFFSGALPPSLASISNLIITGNYFSGSTASFPCPDPDALSFNCFSSVPAKCKAAITPRPANRCREFCGTGTKAGTCGGHGVCRPAWKGSNLLFSCQCFKGFVASKNGLTCEAKSS